MNAQAAEALYEAERNGVPQIKGKAYDNRGGYCAMGVIEKALGSTAAMMLNSEHLKDPCPLCGALPDADGCIAGGFCLTAHLNDDHGMTFGEIARKLGPDSA